MSVTWPGWLLSYNFYLVLIWGMYENFIKMLNSYVPSMAPLKISQMLPLQEACPITAETGHSKSPNPCIYHYCTLFPSFLTLSYYFG